MATTMITRTPTRRSRRTARELARLERAATLYQRREGWAVNDSAEAYDWYRRYLLDNYPAPGWGC
jgi:hypothetical protein